MSANFGLNGAHLDLIDVEQRVQHARHRAQSFVDASDQTLGFVAFHLLGQQALKQSERLQRLSQIVARRRQKARLGDGRQFRLPLGGGQRVGRAPSFGHVFKGYDDALGLLVAGAIGQDPADEPVAALALNFPFDRRLALQDLSGVVLSRASSAASDFRSVSGRPTSLGITLNSAFVAGVKKRMLNRVSRKIVATSVL